ncbi:MAG: type II toxin-antitoxin system Phd/YefM family antitoxin [Proteobacteria bacterium]|nr:type II toxin-antitoxin system Phd/YefM family antitoxin [Pseudomonadota bacterium]
MEIFSYTQARAKLAELMDKAASGQQVIIHRQKAKPVIMISLEDYEQLDETAYLLSSKANARALEESLKEYEAGKMIKFNSIEEMIEAAKKR